jgi:hypothetical protein
MSTYPEISQAQALVRFLRCRAALEAARRTVGLKCGGILVATSSRRDHGDSRPAIATPVPIMGKIYESIDEKLKQWLLAQKIFFVATAPLAEEGHVNCSPKDGESFRIIDKRTAVYLDLTGSGVETIAHVKENERIVLMFCAFTGAPKIVRLHGRGEIIEAKHAEFEQLRTLFCSRTGIRSFIKVHLTRISDSCGYGVPLYDFRGHRSQLEAWAEHQGEESLVEYRLKHNIRSIDQLEGVGADLDLQQSSNRPLSS